MGQGKLDTKQQSDKKRNRALRRQYNNALRELAARGINDELRQVKYDLRKAKRQSVIMLIIIALIQLTASAVWVYYLD